MPFPYTMPTRSITDTPPTQPYDADEVAADKSITLPAAAVDGQIAWTLNLKSDVSPVIIKTADAVNQPIADYTTGTSVASVEYGGAYLVIQWYFVDPNNDGVGIWMARSVAEAPAAARLTETVAWPITLTGTPVILPWDYGAGTAGWEKFWSLQGDGTLLYVGPAGYNFWFDSTVLASFNTTSNNNEAELALDYSLSGTGTIETIGGRFPFQTSRSGSWEATLRSTALVAPVLNDVLSIQAADTPGGAAMDLVLAEEIVTTFGFLG